MQRSATPEVPIATAAPPSTNGTEPGRSLRYAGPVLLAVAFGCIAAVAALGPSAAEPPLGAHDSRATPPWHVAATPPAYLVTVLLVVAVMSGLAVVVLGLTGRWRPRPARLLVAGIIAAGALSLLPPVGSADTLSYAAYGRTVTTGHNPWSTTPRQLGATGDPVGQAVEVPWQDAPSVYGPIATAEQAAASEVGGSDVALTVLLLDVVGALVFAGAGLLLHRLAGDEAGRRRAAVLWAGNPLLWLQLVAGAHLDLLAAGAALAAIAVAGRSRLAAGALAGVAGSIKAPMGLVWLALVWSGRRSRRAVAELTVGALVVAGTGYAVAGTAIFTQLHRASRMVSLGTPWRPIADLGVSRGLISALALLLLTVVAALLCRLHPQIRSGTPAGLALALTLGYTLAAPYSLPWYDAVPWVLIPLLAASRLDAVLLAHTTVLSLAYIPGRAAVPLTGTLHTLTSGMRTDASPALLTLLLLGVVVLATRRAGVWRTSLWTSGRTQ
jgi:alpha-1,6-mannosyltransferase